MYRICRNRRLRRLIFRSNKTNSNTHQNPIGFVYSPLWKITHQDPSVLCTFPFEKSPIKIPSVLCTPPFEKSPIKTRRFYVLSPLKNHPSKTHRFCVLPPLKNHPSRPVGFMYSPLWKITVSSGRLFRGGRLFWQIRCNVHSLPNFRRFVWFCFDRCIVQHITMCLYSNQRILLIFFSYGVPCHTRWDMLEKSRTLKTNPVFDGVFFKGENWCWIIDNRIPFRGIITCDDACAV